MGPQVAGKYVLEHFNHDDAGIRLAFRKMIADWRVNSSEAVKQCLRDLEGTDTARRRNAVDWLANTEVVPSMIKEVQDAIRPLTSSTDGQLRSNAQTIAFRWATAEELDRLVAQYSQNLQNPDRLQRDQALDSLRKIGTTAAARAVLTQFNSPDGGLQFKARNYIGQMNLKQEDVVKQCLADLQDLQRVSPSLNWLSRADVVPSLAKEVVDKVAPFQTSTDGLTRIHAKQTVSKWYPATLVAKVDPTKEKEDPFKDKVDPFKDKVNPPAPALDKALINFSSSDANVKKLALDELVRSKDDKRAIAAIGTWMVTTTSAAERKSAGDGLRQMPCKDNEAFMCQLLLNPNNKTAVKEICAVLEVIGTRECLPVLENAYLFYNTKGVNYNVPNKNAIRKASDVIKASGR
jgi:hypothetical protein